MNRTSSVSHVAEVPNSPSSWAASRAVPHRLDAMSQSKNLIILQEELTKEERFVRMFEAFLIEAGRLVNAWPRRQVTGYDRTK